MFALPHTPSLCALRGINFALFHVGDICRQAGHLAGNVLPAATQEATVVITATDHMTTHYGRITHLRGKPLFPAVGIVLHGQYLPTEVCAGQQWAMTLKVRAVHGQLNEGGFDSQRYALAQHQPLTGRFLQAKAINLSVACVGAILLRFALRLRLIRGSRLFWRWEWGSGERCRRR